MQQQEVSVIIPAFNQLHYCRQCIASILENTRRPINLILVDNGSTDGVSEFFDAVPGAIVIHTGGNLGFAGGVNAGLAHATGHVILLNSDTLVTDRWLDPMLAAIERDARIGMVGPMSNCVCGSQQIDGLSFESMEQIGQFAAGLACKNAGQLRDVARLVGFCLLIREKVWRELGTFDESYGIGNFEDDDYCLRALRAGYRLCVAEDAFVFHYGSRTFLGMGITDDKWSELMNRNEALFHRKWQVKPGERIDAVQQSKRLNALARERLQEGDVTGALRLLKQAIEIFPLDTNYNDAGVILWKMGERDRALAYFNRALDINPQCEDARENLRMAKDI